MSPTQVVVISAPSGTGKTTVANAIVDDLPIRFATSATTRDPRPDEEHGEHYYFYTPEEFEPLIDNDDLIEYEEVHEDTYYGTLREEVEDSDVPVLLDIDVKGGITVKNLYNDAILIFLEPPSLDELRRRLTKRGSHDQDEIDERLQRAKMELTYRDAYDTVITNDDFDATVNQVKQFIKRSVLSDSS